METPEFSLSVQYGTDAPELPRWRFRGWLKGAINYLAKHFELDATRIEISLRIVDADEGRQLNKSFRDKDYATNVLTFEYGVDPMGILRADLVLCYPVLIDEASAQSRSIQDHAAHLTLHGLLHALGYDHLDDPQATEMENLEVELLGRLHIANPYIA